MTKYENNKLKLQIKNYDRFLLLFLFKRAEQLSRTLIKMGWPSTHIADKIQMINVCIYITRECTVPYYQRVYDLRTAVATSTGECDFRAQCAYAN